MRGFESFLQFIVPMSILAIWALTSLLNREAQPLPPRANRPPGPVGPRPGGLPVTPRPPERRPEALSRDPSQRWQAPALADRPGARRPPGGPDDGIVILESESRRPAPPRLGSGGATRRAPRPRTAPPAAAKRPEPSSPRALSTSMAQEAPQQIGRYLELNPLGRASSPLSTQESHDVARAGTPDASRAPSDSLSGDLRSLLGSPAKLREAVILNEILQPPLALRRPRRT